ncbi:hypothetical protein MUO14_23990 [Halobacillus shinanisalinarum]|uniref:Uncharacterized protein n=1 Tax=Halobacillus shinanisalinarum TaxID=2932258 RepID=A0ABY4GZQ2_9BACI|nr:hypothetical protein [Halobacillus shinanisalinarum]UOQ93393.1 hypothetical protein MUO14_23990 [Halobacillus shinanisalinarum]
MDIVVNGSFQNVKEEMKALRSAALDEARNIKKQYKKDDEIPLKVEREYDRLLEQAELLKVSAINPIQLESGLIINYELVKQLMKKLKGFKISMEEKDGQLIINYSKGSTKGTFTLYHLYKLPSLIQMPKGQIMEEYLL